MIETKRETNKPAKDVDLRGIKYNPSKTTHVFDLEKPLFLGCKPQSSKRSGNKEWQVELSLFKAAFRLGECVYGKPVSGTLSRHNSGDLTLYAVNVEGRDFWFDSLKGALSAVREGSLLGKG